MATVVTRKRAIVTAAVLAAVLSAGIAGIAAIRVNRTFPVTQDAD